MTLLMRDIVVGYKRTVAPSLNDLAISLEEAKDELDLTDDSQNTQIKKIIRRATARVEKDARRLIMPQVWQMTLDRFPCGEIDFEKYPTRVVNFLKHTTGGVLTTMDTSLYEADLVSEPARIATVDGASWPSTDRMLKAVQIECQCGYANVAAVPEEVKEALLFVIQRMYDGCELGEHYQTLINTLRADGFVR